METNTRSFPDDLHRKTQESPPPPVTRRNRHTVRKDIQTLRAIAVLVVVLNHLWVENFPGGYIGVDVFFVISGFLITGQLIRELERTGKISFAEFYARRIRRLLPAAMVVSVISLALAWMFLPVARWVTTAQETIAATFYVENWVLAAKSVDYSAQTSATSTVQHYWSLSVEEQFYLFWPLLLVGLFFLAKKYGWPKKSVLISGIIVITAISLLISIGFTYSSKTAAYFVTPTRVWEFGVGAVIALLPSLFPRTTSGSSRTIVSGVLQWTGYAMVISSVWILGAQTPFPGYAALLPVVGTGLIIISGPKSPGWSPGWILQMRPVQFLGDISYSWYLWHWPLIILVPVILKKELDLPLQLALFVAGIFLAFLSKKFIEDPGRTKLFKGKKPQYTYLAMVAAMMLISAFAAGLLVTQPSRAAQDQKEEQKIEQKFQDRGESQCIGAQSLNPTNNCSSPYGSPLVDFQRPSDLYWYDTPECSTVPGSISEVGRSQRTCSYPTPGPANDALTSKKVWLFGDSHAAQWTAGIYEVARKYQWNLTENLYGGCPIVDAKRNYTGGSERDLDETQSCRKWATDTSNQIVRNKPDIVILTNFATREILDDGTGRSQLEQYRDGFKKRVQPWTDLGIKVIVIRDTPLSNDLYQGRLDDSNSCVFTNQNDPVKCALPRDKALPQDPLAEAAATMDTKNVQVVDLSDQFCDDTQCYAAIGGLYVYYNPVHLTRSYSRSMSPILDTRIREAWEKFSPDGAQTPEKP